MADFGCNHGACTILAARNSKIHTIVGFDLNKKAIRTAFNLLNKSSESVKVKNKVNYVVTYLTDIKWPDNYFDSAFMLWNTFGNLYSARDKVLQEARRVVKPDGKIILSVFSENVLPAYLDMLKQSGLSVEHQDENYVFLREGLVSERFSKRHHGRYSQCANLGWITMVLCRNLATYPLSGFTSNVHGLV